MHVLSEIYGREGMEVFAGFAKRRRCASKVSTFKDLTGNQQTDSYISGFQSKSSSQDVITFLLM